MDAVDLVEDANEEGVFLGLTQGRSDIAEGFTGEFLETQDEVTSDFFKEKGLRAADLGMEGLEDLVFF